MHKPVKLLLAAASLIVVLIMLVIHAPEGLVHPMLIALMSKAVPDDAQGEMQGGIASVMNVAMLAGTVFFSQVFGYFLNPADPVPTAGTAYFFAAGFLALALGLFIAFTRKAPVPAAAE